MPLYSRLCVRLFHCARTARTGGHPLQRGRLCASCSRNYTGMRRTSSMLSHHPVVGLVSHSQVCPARRAVARKRGSITMPLDRNRPLPCQYVHQFSYAVTSCVESIALRSATAIRSASGARLQLLSDRWKAVTMLCRWNGDLSQTCASAGSMSAMSLAAAVIFELFVFMLPFFGSGSDAGLLG